MYIQLKTHFGKVFEEPLLEEIARVGTLRDVPQGVELMDIGQPIKALPLMLSGAIKISREDINGDELLLYYLEQGESCTMTMAWHMGEHKSKIRAVTEIPSQLIMVPLSILEQWTGRYPSWRNFVFQSYHNRMEELLETVDNIAFNQLEKRLWDYLLEKKRITKQKTLAITHQTIAQEINSSRVVISRLLKRLEIDQKIILDRNSIQILTEV